MSILDSVQIAKIEWWLAEPALISGLTNNDMAQLALVLLCMPIAYQVKRLLKAALSDTNPWLERINVFLFPVVWLVFLALGRLFLNGHVETALILDLAIVSTFGWFCVRGIGELPIKKEFRRLLTIAVLGLVLLQFTNRLDAVIQFLDGAGIALGSTTISLWSVSKAVFVVFMLGWAMKGGRLWVSKYLKGTGTSAAARTLIDKALLTGGVIVGGLLTLSVLGINLTALTVFGGALGIGLGFGLQAISSNYISGIFLLLDKSIKPGDVISVYDPTGHSSFGHVIQMNARYLVLRKRDGTEVLVPNERLMQNEVVNWSYNSKQVRQEVTVGVSYNSDMENVKEVLTEAVQGVKRVLAVPAPRIFIKEFADSSVVWIIRYWQNDPEEGVNNLKGEIHMAVWKALKDNNIEIPFPQMVLHGSLKQPK